MTTKSKKYYFSGSKEKQSDWNNSKRKFSKLSEYKIGTIIECFLDDMSVLQACKHIASANKSSKISEKTVRDKYREIQSIFVRGAFPYAEIYGGALAPLLIGVPPEYIQEKIRNKCRENLLDEDSKLRIKPNKNSQSHFLDDEFLVFKMERAIREYAYLKIDSLKCMVIFSFAYEKMRRIYGLRGVENFYKFGIEYMAEANWSAETKETGMREADIWENIFQLSRRAESEYKNRIQRDFKWILNEHPLGCTVSKNGTFNNDFKSDLIEEAVHAWFPSGFYY